jgi:hypothetical protein
MRRTREQWATLVRDAHAVPGTPGAQSPPEPKARKPRTAFGNTEQPSLPRVEQTFDLNAADMTCPSCGGALAPMKGQFETSEMVDVVEVRRHLPRAPAAFTGRTVVHLAAGRGPCTDSGASRSTGARYSSGRFTRRRARPTIVRRSWPWASRRRSTSCHSNSCCCRDYRCCLGRWRVPLRRARTGRGKPPHGLPSPTSAASGSAWAVALALTRSQRRLARSESSRRRSVRIPG